MMTNRSDRGLVKPRGSQRFERDDVIREPACGLHYGQQPFGRFEKLVAFEAVADSMPLRDRVGGDGRAA